MRTLFFDSEYNLRSGWKFGIYVFFFILTWFITGNILGMFYFMGLIPPLAISGLGLNVVALFVPAVVALVFVARIIDRVPVSTFGTGLHTGWHTHLLGGVGFASVMLAAMVGGSLLFGEVSTRWMAPSMGTWVVTLLILMVGAANEELVFRGYPMQTLMKGMGKWPAVIIMSSIFGVLHSDNPDSTTLGVFNTILAGILLSIAYLKTRSLWLAYGIHVGWNVGLGIVLGFPVSGIDLETLFATRAAGPSWILGGAYGPEGGVLGTAIFLGGAVFLWKKTTVKVTPS